MPLASLLLALSAGPSLAAPLPAIPVQGVGRAVEIAIDVDFELYSQLGSDLPTTVAFVEEIIHGVDVIFERDANVSVELSALVVRTSPNDPYTSSDASLLLTQTSSEWQSNLAAAQRDVVHLMTGRNISGGTTETGFIGDICGNSGFGLTEVRLPFDLDAHVVATARVLARNFGAPSCTMPSECGILCGEDFCPAQGGPALSPSTAAIISANAAGLPCLRDLAPPLTLPVLDTFPNDTADETIWVSNPPEGPSNGAVAPPSAPFAMLLTASGALAGLDNRWISNQILAGSAVGLNASYMVQHRGVPAGRELVVEFIDITGAWQVLDVVVSDGTNQTTFAARAAQIPAAGSHDALQLRFTVDVDGPAEEWFVDNFGVQAAISSFCIAGANSVDPAGASLFARSSSSTSIAANDLLLVATQLPSNAFGIYLFADDRNQTILGDGFLCVTGSPITRAAVAQANGSGISTFALDQTALPQGTSILPGDTVRFQLWYRDTIGAGFNLTNGVEANFVP